MNLNDPSIREDLGFDQILEIIEKQLLTEEGASHLADLKAYTNLESLQKELSRTGEMMAILEEATEPDWEYTRSPLPLLAEARVGGNWLKATDFVALLKWIRTSNNLHTFFRNQRENCPEIWEILQPHEPLKMLEKSIEKVIEPTGEVKDNASEKLLGLRREIRRNASDLRRKLNRLLKTAKSNGWTQHEEVTIRNDRLVLPLNADFKGKIPGFVQDVSQSGSTIFVEPSESLELNNSQKRLLAEERNEIVRILTDLTLKVRVDDPRIRAWAELMGSLDLIRSKAKLANRLKAEIPSSSDPGTYRLVNARHPLLVLKGTEVVPLSLKLTKEDHLILVSGPNAGGKTVALKTLGLLQIMWQHGMPVSAEKSSAFRLFSKIFVDIGDQQSIQSDLSTYTSHLANMRAILEEADPGTLILIDEFGSGTDPRMGGAIAEAFLTRFVNSRAFGIITTHYGNLKATVEQLPGIQNAAMQFDPLSLAPTFRMEVGMPGRSYAFEIARKVGVTEELLNDARSRMEASQRESEELLIKLEAQKAELERVLTDNRDKQKQLKYLLEKNRNLREETEQKKDKVLRQAEEQARNLIKQANKKIELTIKEIREEQAEKEKTRKLRKELAMMLPEPSTEDLQEPEEEEVLPPEVIKGESPVAQDWVMIKDNGAIGQLIQIQGKRGVVTVGDLRITVKMNNLMKIKAPKVKEKKGSSYQHGGLIQRTANATHKLDVKGLRVEQALPMVQKFVDDAILANFGELRILHGKGTGALRTAIRDFLSQVPDVEEFGDAHIEAGGAGWTIIQLRQA